MNSISASDLDRIMRTIGHGVGYIAGDPAKMTKYELQKRIAEVRNAMMLSVPVGFTASMGTALLRGMRFGERVTGAGVATQAVMACYLSNLEEELERRKSICPCTIL